MILRLLLYLYTYTIIPWEMVRDTDELISPIHVHTLCQRIGINILRIALSRSCSSRLYTIYTILRTFQPNFANLNAFC